MLRNYLVVAVRNLVRRWPCTAVNIAGLAIGVACSLLALIYPMDELSYDQHHQKLDQVFRIASPRP